MTIIVLFVFYRLKINFGLFENFFSLKQHLIRLCDIKYSVL